MKDHSGFQVNPGQKPLRLAQTIYFSFYSSTTLCLKMKKSTVKMGAESQLSRTIYLAESL